MRTTKQSDDLLDNQFGPFMQAIHRLAEGQRNGTPKHVFEASFADWVKRVHKRLEHGRLHYGDESLSRPLPVLYGEIGQELLDVGGWGCLAWPKERLERRRTPEGIVVDGYWAWHRLEEHMRRCT